MLQERLQHSFVLYHAHYWAICRTRMSWPTRNRAAAAAVAAANPTSSANPCSAATGNSRVKKVSRASRLTAPKAVRATGRKRIADGHALRAASAALFF